MNTTDEITTYVDEVRAALADLPDGVRAELTEDLPEHLAEVRAEGEGSLVDRLGTPQAYATELRAAAGLVAGFPDPPGPDGLARLRATVRADLIRMRTVAQQKLAAADVRVGPLLGYARAGDFLRLLRPAWWVLRGYLAVMVLAWLLDGNGQPIGLLPRIGGSAAVALVLLAGGVLGSIWLGRRPGPRAPLPRYALYSATVVLVLVALAGFLDADRNSREVDYQGVYYDDPYNGIRDVFVYDAQGRLLTGVRLFDQNGQPIQLGEPMCSTPQEPVTGPDRFPEPMVLTYPYCPADAPFMVPGADGAAVVPAPTAPSEGPPLPSGPAPTPSGPAPPPSAAAPSGSPGPAPAPARSAASPSSAPSPAPTAS